MACLKEARVRVNATFKTAKGGAEVVWSVDSAPELTVCVSGERRCVWASFLVRDVSKFQHVNDSHGSRVTGSQAHGEKTPVQPIAVVMGIPQTSRPYFKKLFIHRLEFAHSRDVSRTEDRSTLIAERTRWSISGDEQSFVCLESGM